MSASHTKMRCRLCMGPCHEQVLDFGPQPICNRFLKNPQAPQDLFPLALCYCPVCCVPQVVKAAPASKVKPPFDWITYREAEPHLDEMVERALSARPCGSDAVIGGLTYKDTTTLERFRRKGFQNVWELSPRDDLGCENNRAEMETVQDRLTPERAGSITARRGACDILIARHLIEHSHDPLQAMNAVKELLKPDGLVIFEVPDFARCMDGLDYAPIWEEHILYFDRDTLPAAVETGGFSVVQAYEHPYTLENAVICMARPAARKESSRASALPHRIKSDRWARYAGSIASTRKQVRDRLVTLRAKYGAIALFGAGHLTCKFINLYQVADLLDFVADNDPNKTGMFMAGSGLPILPSDELIRRKIKVCLMGLSPDSERKVRDAHRAFTDGGGIFLSVFPSNPACFMKDIVA